MSNPPKKNKKQESQDKTPWYDQYSYDTLDIHEARVSICVECGGQFTVHGEEEALCPDCEDSLEDMG